MSSSVQTDISIEYPSWSKKRLALPKFSEDVLTLAWKSIKGKSKAEPLVSITFTEDKHVKKLNKKFRDKNKPTNVLSFQTWENIESLPAGMAPIGDIVFAFETVEREAQEKGISFKDHLTHLLIHGFLHLLGYDHMNDREAEIMEGLEIKILKKIGIKNPYAEI